MPESPNLDPRARVARASGQSGQLHLEENLLPVVVGSLQNAATRQRRHYERVTVIELGLVVGAAGLSTAAVQTGIARPIAVSVAVLLLGATIVRLAGQPAVLRGSWIESLMAAATVRSNAWRFMMRVFPYQDDATARNALTTFIESVLEDTDVTGALAAPAEQGRLITSRAEEIRARTQFSERRDFYIGQRLDQQRMLYNQLSAVHGLSRASWRNAALAVEFGALAWAVLRAAYTDIINIVGLLTTLVVAATAIAGLKDRRAEAPEPARTAQHLLILRTRIEHCDQFQFLDLVREAEEWILTEEVSRANKN